MSHKKITYYGIDDEISAELKEYCGKFVLGEYRFKSFLTKDINIAQYCLHESQNIVFIDFTGVTDQGVKEILTQVHFVKKQSARRSVLFVAIFENKGQAQEYSWVYSKGFQFSFIKGQDIISFFMDCYRIAVSDDYALPRYAQATRINQTLTLSCCSNLVALGHKYALIETDIKLQQTDEQLSANLPGFLNLKKAKFKVREHYNAGIMGLGLDTYLVEMPLSSPWDDVTEDTIAPETIQTWMDNHEDEFNQMRPYVYLFNLDEKESNLSSALSSSAKIDLNFVFEDLQLDEDILREQISLRRPPLLLIQLEGQKADEYELDGLEKIVNCIRGLSDYRPIVVIGSCPSSSEAMRKSFGHEGLLSHPQELKWETIAQLASKFAEKRPEGLDLHDLNFLDTQIAASYAEHCLEVEVTSLTEHEITFITPLDIPMFSVLKTRLPILASITIIPPAYELETSPKGQHYMGVFHGCPEEELNKLRKFINQLIYQPLNEFSEEEVQRILSQKPKEIQELQLKEQKLEPKRQTKVQTDQNKTMTETHKRVIISGRSKL